MMTAASQARPPAAPAKPAPGWVRTFQVNEDRSVTLTCFHPAHGEDIEIRVVALELDTMLRQVREPRKTDRRNRPL